MDVNGTNFHLLLTADDWLERGDPKPTVSLDSSGRRALEWRETTGLAPTRRGFLFKRGTGAAPLDADQKRGSDRDEYGTWYMIGEDNRSVERLLRDGTITTMWPSEARATPTTGPFATRTTPGPLAPTRGLAGLAVTSDHHLVVGASAATEGGDGEPDSPGLLVFDLYDGGSPLFVPFPADFDPIDMKASEDGRLLILDRAAGSVRYWCLDRWFSVASPGAIPAAGLFRPKTGADHEPAVLAPAINETGAYRVDVPNPVSIDSLADGTVVIMGRVGGQDASSLFRFQHGESSGPPLSLAGALGGFIENPEDPTDVLGRDLAIVPEPRGTDDDDPQEVIFVSDRGGDQAFAFTIAMVGGEEALRVRPAYYPLRLHNGRGLVAADGEVWFDTLDAWHQVAPHGRPRYSDGGLYTSTVFDGNENSCVWHRLFVDGEIPAGSEISVETRAADDLDTLLDARWKQEPRLYRRRQGSELALYDPTPSSESATTWETLLQEAKGRFLQFRLRFDRSGDAPPKLIALRLYFPRFSYRSHYLPEVYGEDRQSADLLDRFLANPEGMLTTLEGRIANAQALFDHRSAPDEALDWLASWLGAVLDADWEPARRRAFLDNANELFQWRGTMRGLTAAIRLATDTDPRSPFDRTDGPFGVRIVEQFATRRLGAVPLGDPTGPADLPLVDDGDRWTPELGGSVLASRFDAFVTRVRPQASAADRVLGPTTPAEQPRRDEWSAFLSAELGVAEPRFHEPDLPVYRRFLVQRYGRFAAYRAAYGATASGTSFDTVELPTVLPAAGPALRDWTELLARILPMARQAHRFSVLVPVPLEITDDERQLLIDRVRSVVARQRPAHTVFEVKPFWAALNVGTARLGLDTQVGLGARFVPLIIGRGRLAKSYLDAGDRHRRRVVVGNRLPAAGPRTIPSNRREN